LSAAPTSWFILRLTKKAEGRGQRAEGVRISSAFPPKGKCPSLSRDKGKKDFFQEGVRPSSEKGVLTSIPSSLGYRWRMVGKTPHPLKFRQQKGLHKGGKGS
jgi:hypothetical protein